MGLQNEKPIPSHQRRYYRLSSLFYVRLCTLKGKIMQYKIEVQTIGDPKWYTNAMVYETRKEAEIAGQSLFDRWLLTTAFRVVEKVSQKPE